MRGFLRPGIWCLVPALLLSGCAPAEVSVSAESLIGKTVPEAMRIVPADIAFSWYDVSPTVLNKRVSIDNPEGQGATIVGVCSEDEIVRRGSTVAVAVIPSIEMTSEIATEAQEHAFRDAIPGCDP